MKTPYQLGQVVQNTRTGERGKVVSCEGSDVGWWFVVVVLQDRKGSSVGFDCGAEGHKLWKPLESQ